ncbi:MAG: CocE/NonD family hydrolase [Candidatus Korobacteraceae bacterium]
MEPTQTMTKSVVADGMRIDWDVAIPMEDGIILRADVFRPLTEGRYPAIMNLGPYAKGLAFQDNFYKGSWNRMISAYPEVAEGSTNKYQNWEVVDPEKWVPDGYVCVRVDSRGAGHSPGQMEVWSPRESKDFYNCIEWAAAQSWSNGKIGLNGISYYAMNQWYVASERQYGYGERGVRSWVTGELIAGPETLPEEVLAKNRIDPGPEVLKRPLDGEYYRDRSPKFDKITVPLLSAANWGGMGLHPRGNFEGYLAAASKQKWLQVHGDSHFSPFYRKDGETLQKRFFGHFLKGENTGWEKQPPVQLHVRHPGEKFVVRDEREWPLARTQWTKFYLDPSDCTLGREPKSGAAIEYETTGDGLRFTMPPQSQEVEITGPVAAKLFVSSETTDADLFLALRLFDPAGKEVLFIGSNDPCVPIALGWLRASHRKLDPKRSLPYRPYHTHDESWPLKPGELVELDIEIWPTSIVVPPGYQFVLNVRGKDFDHGQGDRGFANAMYPMRGVGNLLHNDPQDRPAAIFGCRNRLHFEKGKAPYLLLPIIPPISGK